MSDYQKPKHPKKAGLTIALIVLAVIAVIFIGMNLFHADESEATDADSSNPHAIDQPAR